MLGKVCEIEVRRPHNQMVLGGFIYLFCNDDDDVILEGRRHKEGYG